MGLVAGLAATALTGCVSVQPRPDAPARPGTGGPAQDLTPQTAQPPVHDSLEAVPASEPPASPPLPAPVAGTDVCALGRGYGHWPAGSPQSRICENTYGR
ncbi:hypothetical protein [Streptomyces sp. sk2.1]|uniref:hypothetical protein n=1 Tax=Streptomyces sp. sk2.1 TaxID=2478959 RepID=UPI0011E68C50|nr:hypothetical protein [Streptomyces sp. sk2.1]TXS70377.1 hypothetical protein EAO76_22755 [Streptomyces sp. sk2.1]